MKSCSTNHRRTSFSLLVLPEAREAAPVSITTAARLYRSYWQERSNPTPICFCVLGSQLPWETAKFVCIVIFSVNQSWFPHWIGDDAIKGPELVALPEFRILEGITDGRFALHVVNDLFMLAMAQVSERTPGHTASGEPWHS